MTTQTNHAEQEQHCCLPPRISLGRMSRRPGESRRAREQRCIASLLADRYGYEVRLEHHASGAPYLPDHPKDHISISHSDCFAMIVISSDPIGADIEDIGDQVERVEEKFVNPYELDRLEGFCSKKLALHLLWTAKEAAYKLTNPPSGSLKEFTLRMLESFNPIHQIARCILRTSEGIEIEALLTWADDYVSATATYLDL